MKLYTGKRFRSYINHHMITINMFDRVFLKTTSKQQSFRWQNEIPLKLVVNEKKSVKSLGQYKILVTKQIFCFFFRLSTYRSPRRNIKTNLLLPSQHGCISDASLTFLKQRLKNISKMADLQIFETSLERLIKDVSSETSLRSLRSS